MCNFPSGVKLPVVVERLLLINVTIGETFDLQVPFIQVKPFREHPYRKWLGENSILQIWSTEFQDEELLLLHSVIRKCSIVKDFQKFERFELSNGKRSALRREDEVNFIV